MCVCVYIIYICTMISYNLLIIFSASPSLAHTQCRLPQQFASLSQGKDRRACLSAVQGAGGGYGSREQGV